MYNFRFNKIALTLGLASLAAPTWAGLHTGKAIVGDDQTPAMIHADVNFPNPVTGDLYIATMIDQQLYFFAGQGQVFSTEVRPFISNQDFSGEMTVLNLSSTGVPAGNYPLYQVVTTPGSDPLDFSNWIGGPSGLSVINFAINLPVTVNGDFNGDGFADDDANHDGYHDDDGNKDGFHDDDANHDGYHDNDLNHNGIPDPLENSGPDGKTLYESNCMSCHGATPNADARAGKDPNEIRNAINRNKGGMGFLNGLTDSELQAISNYLKTF